MPNGNQRGSVADRRARKVWLVETFGIEGIVTCTFCAVPLLIDDVVADRIVPGWLGGRYVRGNIRPSCLPCSHEQGARMSHEVRLSRC
jgi:hypothetical protein